MFSATTAAVVQLLLRELVRCIISLNFMCDKKFHVVLCRPRTRSWQRHFLATPLSLLYSYDWAEKMSVPLKTTSIPLSPTWNGQSSYTVTGKH